MVESIKIRCVLGGCCVVVLIGDATVYRCKQSNGCRQTGGSLELMRFMNSYTCNQEALKVSFSIPFAYE
jgi:hypothetical protein